MNIAFDAKRITHNKTGLGNYSRFIIRTLAEYCPENNYLLASYNEGESKLYEDLLQNRCVQMLRPKKNYGKAFEPIWRNWALRPQLKLWDIDVFHGLSNEIPIILQRSTNRRTATIVTIHDLIALRHPEYYNFIDRNLYKFKYLNSAKHSDHIIAVSNKTKEDLIEFTGIKEEKISVIYQGCSRIFSHIPKVTADWVKAKYKLNYPFILFVGSIETRKNIKLVVKALSIMKEKDIHFIAIGKKTPYADEVIKLSHSLGLKERVHLIHGVEDNDLAGFYKLAKVFVYPSHYEGFGIPIIEAINANLPVIAASGSCLEEAGGPDCLYTDPNDSEMLADMISNILNDREKSIEMVKAAQTYIRKFSPKEISRALKGVYSTVMLR